jgi:hypothetical protein
VLFKRDTLINFDNIEVNKKELRICEEAGR